MRSFLIVIPYRGRYQNLSILLPHLEWYLKGHKFNMLVIEQDNRKPFNKGHLFNTAFFLFENEFDYFVFHDVDLLPLQADYSFPTRPVHLGTHLSQYGYRNLHPRHLAGVSLFNRGDFRKINGFSNDYRGWGIEDEDIYFRCKEKKLGIERRSGRFISLPHKLQPGMAAASIKNWMKLEKHKSLGIDREGLSTLKFKIARETTIKTFSLNGVGWNTQLSLKKPVKHLWVRGG